MNIKQQRALKEAAATLRKVAQILVNAEDTVDEVLEDFNENRDGTDGDPNSDIPDERIDAPGDNVLDWYDEEGDEPAAATEESFEDDDELPNYESVLAHAKKTNARFYYPHSSEFGKKATAALVRKDSIAAVEAAYKQANAPAPKKASAAVAAKPAQVKKAAPKLATKPVVKAAPMPKKASVQPAAQPKRRVLDTDFNNEIMF